jgi:4-methylaminobutanoate oxidase (formaldehyde-forming)
MPADGSVSFRDVTSERAVINLVGPKARAVLEQVTTDDVSNTGFPFLAVREIGIGMAPVTAARIGYVGELGWELHMAVEFAPHVYEVLKVAGATHGIADVGYKAIETLRLEKGYLYWSSDIGPDYTPYEAGLGFCVALDKGEFIGRSALEQAKAGTPKRRLCAFTVEGFAPFHGGEAILRGGTAVGNTTSAGFGHTVGKSIAFGYLPTEFLGGEDFEIEAFGVAHKARKGPRTLYDAAMARLKS